MLFRIFNFLIDFFVVLPFRFVFSLFVSHGDEASLRYCNTYQEYLEVGMEIDKKNEQWKKTHQTDLCDWVLVKQRTEKLEYLLANAKENPNALAKALSSELRRNLGSMGNPDLYNSHCVIGTKHFVSYYNQVVCKALEFLCHRDFGSKFSLEEKVIIFLC